MSNTFQKNSDAYRQHIEQFLEEQCFQHDSEPQKTLFDSMRYSLLAGGKRVRPVIVLEFAKAAGGDGSFSGAAPAQRGCGGPLFSGYRGFRFRPCRA